MKKKTVKILSIILALCLGAAFVVRFGGPGILRLYVETGMGVCSKSPVLCIKPNTEISEPLINEEYLAGLLLYKLPQMEIRLPKEFKVVKELVTKVYYKKRKDKLSGSVVYLLHENRDFFITAFPQVAKAGVRDDYQFITRVNNAQSAEIKNINDAFFVIMKGIFTPDMGSKNQVKISTFSIADKKGFITYSMGPEGNFFDCNMVSSSGDFFKVYIRDKNATLDIDKLAAIISTVRRI